LKYKPFEESKRFVRKLGLKNQNEWREYSKSTDKPLDIPADPSAVYKEDWKGMGDWLGTEFIAPQNRIYKSFDEAKKFVQHSIKYMMKIDIST
jgi:hypothetical protein